LFNLTQNTQTGQKQEELKTTAKVSRETQRAGRVGNFDQLLGERKKNEAPESTILTGFKKEANKS